MVPYPLESTSTSLSSSPTVVTPRCYFSGSSNSHSPKALESPPPVDRIIMSYQGNTWVAIRYGAGRFRRRRSIPGWGRIIEAILVDAAEIGNSEAFGEQRKETGKSQPLTRSCVGHGPIERANGAGPIRGQRAGTLPLRGLRTVNREFVWTRSQSVRRGNGR